MSDTPVERVEGAQFDMWRWKKTGRPWAGGGARQSLALFPKLVAVVRQRGSN